jgi:hypothetical protein
MPTVYAGFPAALNGLFMAKEASKSVMIWEKVELIEQQIQPMIVKRS